MLAVSALLLLGSSASALCMLVPFDKLVHDEPVIWWGKVVGVQKVDVPSASWALSVRIDQVLKGTESVGDVRPAQLGSCGYTFFPKRSTAEQYVGQTRLFMGSISNGVLETVGVIFRPQGLSVEQQYQRALKDLGLERAQPATPSASPLPPIATSGFPVWVVILLVGLVVLVAVAAFFVAHRRRPSAEVE